MEEFFVEKAANADGAHVLHIDGCPSLPAKDKLNLIGVRSGSEAPMKEVSNWYGSAAACPECIKS